MSVTVRDVAKRAGVSVGTVSRYLNGYSLREENRQRIKEAIDALGFKENIIAKGLKNNRSMAIGVVLASLTDIFATSIVTAAERIAAKENFSFIVCDYEGSLEKMVQKLDFLRSRSVDGLILFPSGHSCPKVLQAYLDAGIPVVIVNDDMPAFRTDKVTVDNSNASFRAVEWLIHSNHRDIAIINGDTEVYTGRERLKGYLEALQVYEIPINKQFITCGHFSHKGGYEAAKTLLTLETPPTALYITNYYMTFGAIMAVNELKISVPQQLSIIGFDHFEISDVINPSLTVIEQPTDKIGEMAAKTVIRRIRGDYSDFPVDLSIKTRMLVRDSVSRLEM
jgi:LacI family transcriptional regulator